MAGDLLTIAELSGVFVGFAALIGFASERTSIEKSILRTVVLGGIGVMLAAILPWVLLSFAVREPTVWRVASAIYLTCYILFHCWWFFGPRDKQVVLGLQEDMTANRPFHLMVGVGLDLLILLSILIPVVGVLGQYWQGLYSLAVVLALLQTVLNLPRLLPK